MNTKTVKTIKNVAKIVAIVIERSLSVILRSSSESDYNTKLWQSIKPTYISA